MDSSKATPLIDIKEFAGLDTQSALPAAPRVAHNVQYTRHGGYAPQRASKPLLGGVLQQLLMGVGNDFWVLRNNTVVRLRFTGDGAGMPDAPIADYDDPVALPAGAPLGEPFPSAVHSLAGAVRLLPGIAVLPNGDYINQQGWTYSRASLPDPKVRTVPVSPPPETGEDTDSYRGRHFKPDVEYVVHYQRLSDGAFRSVPVTPGPSGKEYTVVLDTGFTAKKAVWVETKAHSKTMFGGLTMPVPTNIKFIGITTDRPPRRVGPFILPDTRQFLFLPTPDPDAEDVQGVEPQADELVFDGIRTAEYHLGRAWVAAAGVTNRFGVHADKVVLDERTEIDPMTVYYSEVTAPYKSPRWRADNYITIPARVSRQIVAMVSVGRLLYVLGDREVFIISGNSDRDFQVECIGDSIGCVSANSVQTLGGVVFYLSDSGVLALSGTNTQNISENIANLIEEMGRTVSSTVDHRTETYMIRGHVGDTLCFNVPEKAWSTRDSLGMGETLLRAGGLPLSLYRGTLYRLDAPDGYLLSMRIRFPWLPAGSWAYRKHHRGVLMGATGSGTATVTVEVLDYRRETDDPVIASKAAHVTINGQQRSIPVSTNGLTGEACRVTIETTGDILVLPPLTVAGEVKGEVMAQ